MYNFFNQYGAGLNPDKIWNKYKNELIKKLTTDDSFLRIEKNNPLLLTELPKDFIESDITNEKYTYLEWIITSYLNNGINKYEDLLSRTKPALKNFHYLKNKGVLEHGDNVWSDETNIVNFCGIKGCTIKNHDKQGLESLLDKYKELLDENKIETIKKKDMENRIVYKDEEITVYNPTTKEESCYYGQGTKWCTATKEDNMFDEYNKQGPLYIIVPKHNSNPNPNNKKTIYQIHPATNSYMDDKDEEVTIEFLSKNFPTLIDANILTINDIITTTNINLIKVMLSKNFKFDENSLNIAIETKNIIFINEIIDLGAEPDENALDNVIPTKNLEIIDKIIDLGAQPDEYTLTYAIETKNLEIIDRIIQLGVEPNDYTLTFAIKTKNIEIIDRIINLGAQPDKNTLNYAINTNSPEIMITCFKYILSLDETQFPIIIKLLEGNKYNYVKYKLLCDAHNYLGLDILQDILKSVNILKINDKDINNLNKVEICDFLNEKYKTSDVIFNI